MAHGLSLELNDLDCTEWESVDLAKLADARKTRRIKKILSKRIRNKLWKSVVFGRDKRGKLGGSITASFTRSEYMKVLRERIQHGTV